MTLRTLFLAFIVFIFTTIASAQTVCSDLVNRALEQTTTVCNNPQRNTICYGNGIIFAQAATGVALDFDNEGDIAPLENFAGITHTPLDEVAEIWGVSLMNLQADIPDTAPGQSVQIVVFGNVEIDEVTTSAFRFTTGIGTSSCAEAPSSGIMVRTPEGLAQVTLSINDVEITMGSTAFIEATLEDGMTVTMLDGTARVTAFGTSQIASFSQQLNIPLQLDEQQNLVPSAPPSPAQSWDAAEIAKVFVVYSALNRIETEPVEITSTPLPPPTAVPTQTALPTFTALPTLTFTPSPTNTPQPCTISTPQTDVIIRVGPGYTRGTFIFLEPNSPVFVTGKKIVEEETWWRIEKSQVTSRPNSVNELWVAAVDVTENGDCDLVIDVDAPPIVRPQPTAAPLPTATPTGITIIEPTSEFVPAVEPVIFLSAVDDDILMGECTDVIVNVEFITEAYFDGPGFIADNTVEGPSWITEVCPPDEIGFYTYTLDVISLSGNQIQRFVTIEIR